MSYEDAANAGPGSVNMKVLPNGPLWSSVNSVNRPSDGSESVIVAG